MRRNVLLPHHSGGIGEPTCTCPCKPSFQFKYYQIKNHKALELLYHDVSDRGHDLYSYQIM